MTGAILTAIGKAKLASATSENQLEITHVAVGDGNGSYPVLTENRVALANEVWRGTASTPIHDTQAPNTLMFESAIPPDVGGFTIREIAVFDSTGAMIAIGHVDPTQQKPLPKQSIGINMTVRIVIALANAAETNLILQTEKMEWQAGKGMEQERPEEPVTHVSRRKLLTAFGMAGAALAAGSILPGSVAVYGKEGLSVAGTVYEGSNGKDKIPPGIAAKLELVTHNELAGREMAGAHPASAILDSSGLSQQQVNDYNRYVDSISDMLAIISPENGMRVAVKGYHSPVSGKQGGWFKFNASKILENDGGIVFSGWERIDYDVITFDMFGLDNTGTIAVDAKLINLAAASTALKKPVHQFNGEYLLDGSSDITFTENTLLDGSKFIIGPNFTGRIICKRADEVREEITSGTLFDQVKAVGNLYKGQTFLNLGTYYQDHYMTFETSQPMYYYRGTLETAFLKTRHFREGRIQSGPFFTLDLTKLTKIRVARANDSIRLFSGFCFDESNAGALADYFKLIQSNMVVMRNLRYVNRGPERNSNQTRLTVDDCYNVLIDTLDTSSPHANPNGTFTYTLTLSDCYDVEVKKMQSQGRGWGTIGNNNCALVTFTDCDVNRIDFHRPCYDKLTIRGCRIGDFGIIASLVCDTYITDSAFLMSQGYGNRGYIRSNADTSGFCNGDLIINNVTINGYLANGATFIHARHGATALPAGSPLVQEMFTDVYIDGLRHNGSAGANITSLFSSNNTSSIINMLPKRIYVSNSSADLPSAMFDIHVDKYALRPEGVDIKYTNVSTNSLSFRDSTGVGTKGRVKLLNVSGQDAAAGTALYNTANFDIETTQCEFSQYSEYIGTWTAYLPKITINGGSISNTTDKAMFNTPSGIHNTRIKAINVDFNMPSTTYLAILYRYQPISCWFNGLRYITRFVSAGVASGSFDIDTRSGTLRLLLEHGTLKYETTLAPVAGTYNTANGATIVVTVVGVTATITVNATNLKLIGLLGIV